MQEQLVKADRECQAVSGLTEEELDTAHNFPAVGQNDPKITKHLICFCQKLKYVDERGIISEETARTRLARANTPQDKIDKVVKDCIVQKSTIEETVHDFVKCKRGILGVHKFDTKH